jgi:hypothetical protein
MAANEASQHAPKGPNFFSFGEDEGVIGFIGLFSSQCVPQIDPQVLNVFPNMFSIAPHFILHPLP